MNCFCKVTIISLTILSLICVIIRYQLNNKSKSIEFCGVDNYFMENINDNSFNIHLLSNVESPFSHRNNTVANYVTKLPEKIQLTSEWEVGLAEMSYTKSWFNIRENYSIEIFTTDGNQYTTDDAILKKGYYPTIEFLISKINERLKVYERGAFKNDLERSPSLRYDAIFNRIYITNGITKKRDSFVYPILAEDLELMLGLRNDSKVSFLSFFYNEENNTAIDESSIKLNRNINYEQKSNEGNFTVEFESPYPVQFNISELHLLVYCSIVQPVIVGNIQTNLLRQVEIPKGANFGEQCVLRYPQPFYYPIVSHEFDTIEIDIKDDVNERIPFDGGRSTVTLHFRKRK